MKHLFRRNDVGHEVDKGDPKKKGRIDPISSARAFYTDMGAETSVDAATHGLFDYSPPASCYMAIGMTPETVLVTDTSSYVLADLSDDVQSPGSPYDPVHNCSLVSFSRSSGIFCVLFLPSSH